MSQNSSSNNGTNNQSFDFQAFYHMCLQHWRWFAISFVIIVGFTGIKVFRAEKQYGREATIMVKEDASSSALGDMATALGDMSGISTSSLVDNELEAIKSPAVMLKVIEELDLNTTYKKTHCLRPRTLYGSSQPFLMYFPDTPDNHSVEVIGTYTPEGTYTIEEIIDKYEKEEDEYDDLNYTLNTTLPTDSVTDTPIGRIVVCPNPRFSGKTFNDHGTEDMTITVEWAVAKSRVEYFCSTINAELANRRASVINISTTDASIERAEDILNKIIEVYNRYWVEDQNLMVDATAAFIDQRLEVIKKELLEVDSDITAYKSENAVPDIAASIQADILKQSESDQRIIELQSQYTMAKNLVEYINNPANASNVLPALTIAGLDGSTALNSEIAEYNKKLMDRNRLFQSTSSKNPLIKDYDNSLAEMRAAIASAVDTQAEQIKTMLNNQIADRNATTGRIAQSPERINDLAGIERQQTVKEQLYLFLLQKRESNDLTKAFIAYNTRIITPPMGSFIPVAPKLMSSLIIAFIFSMLVPIGLLYIKNSLDTLVRSREDIDGRVKAPFLGNIPFYGKRPSRWRTLLRRKREIDDNKPVEAVVKHGNGSPVNEAFRMVRSNLELMNSRLAAGRESQSVVTMVTSAIPGSGKTFVSLNLGVAYALKKKRIVVVDVDLRKATLSKNVGAPTRGVSTYLSGQCSIEDITHHNACGIEYLDIIPAGIIPPDPAELIDSPRFVELLEELRKHYDIVLLDCPPTEPVTDSSIITQHVDRTVYVVRVGHLHRTFLDTLQEYYTDKRYTNLSVVLNATEITRGASYGYGYGYGAENNKD